MLMMCSKNLIVDNSTIRTTDFIHGFVNGLGGQNTGCPDFKMNIRSLTKLPCLKLVSRKERESYKGIFVVCNCDDILHNKNSCTSNSCNIGAVVGVFPANSTILLMQTDCILHLDWLAIVVGNISVKVLLSDEVKSRTNLDDTKTITTKLEIVGGDSSPDITEIKSRFAVIRRPRVCIRNKHI